MRTILLLATILFAANTLYGVVQILDVLSDVLSSAPRVQRPGLFGLGATGALLIPGAVTATMGLLMAACWRGFQARGPKRHSDDATRLKLVLGDRVMTESGAGKVVRWVAMTDSVIVDLEVGGTISVKSEGVKKLE